MFSHSAKVLFIVISCVFCQDMKGSRQARTFTFIPEAEDINVGLDFSLPFIKIPIKKTFNSVSQYGIPGVVLPKININPMALALSSIIIFFVSVVGPIINKAFEFHGDRQSRHSDSNDWSSFVLTNVTEHLAANSGGCPERVVCWMSQRTRNPESMYAWKQIMSNRLLSIMLNTTALKEATVRGSKGYNCDAYTPCPIQKESLPRIINSFSTLTHLKH